MMNWNRVFSENRVLICLQEAEGLRRVQTNCGIDHREAIAELFEVINDHIGFCSLSFLTEQSGRLKGTFGCQIEEI